MPVPKSFFSLIEEHKHKGSKFPSNHTWLDDYGAYKFCYIPNIRDIAGKFGVTDINTLAREDIKQEALRLIPAQWKKDWGIGEFDKLSTTQSRAAWKRNPMRADKLAMVLIMLHVAIERGDQTSHHKDVSGKTIFDVVKLRPAIFAPDDPNNICRDLNVADCQAIQAAALQPQSNPIRTCGGYLGPDSKKSERGKPVTFPTAAAIADHLDTLIVQVQRNHIPAPKRANNGEVV